MRTVDFYIDTAKEKSGIKSDTQLGKNIGLSRGAINQFRTKRAWPAEETITRLAELAGIPPEEAVLELNAWRSTGKTQIIYKKLIERLGRALTVLVIIFIGFFSIEKSAFAYSGNIEQPLSEKYILSHNYTGSPSFLNDKKL